MSTTGRDVLSRIETFLQKGETEHGFAKRIGVKPQTYRDWKLLRDAGRDFYPRIQTLRTVAEKLGVSLEWLLLGGDR